MKVAVVGATGAVGREMTRILEERSFPVDAFVPLASVTLRRAHACGSRTRSTRCGSCRWRRSRGVDVALVSAGADVSRSFIPRGRRRGHHVHRQLQRLPDGTGRAAVDPRGEPRGARGHPKIVAVPNCTTITAMLAVGPAAPRRRPELARDVVVPVRVRRGPEGRRASCSSRSRSSTARRRSSAHPDADALPGRRGVRQDDRLQRRGEDRRVRGGRLHGRGAEDHGRAAEDPRSPRPPRGGHGGPRARFPSATRSSIVAEFDRAISPDEARDVMRAAPGVELRDDPANDSTRARSRRRDSTSRSSGGSARSPARRRAELFSCADNLRKGAALDAVQIAEHLFARLSADPAST